MSEWISVEDRLPAIGKYVLVCLSDGERVVAQRYTRHDVQVWIINDLNERFPLDDVAYWMPLPEPPTE